MPVMDFIKSLFRTKPTEAEAAKQAHVTAQIKVATYQQGEATRRLERLAEKAINSSQSAL